MSHETINENSRKAIEGLQPEMFWKYFYEISRIPHGSKNEQKLVDYIKGICDFFKKNGKREITYEQDEIGNFLVRTPASDEKFREAPIVALQAHLDMVNEKNRDSNHDFEKDPIELVRSGKFIMANGTTLGADDGVGVALMLMFLEKTCIENSLDHGQVNLIFTVQEEIGLIGATNIDESFCDFDYLINLDGRSDSITVGCSGGENMFLKYNIEWTEIPEGFKEYNLLLTGLLGGHSANNIADYRANSVKIFFLFLDYLDSEKGFSFNDKFRISYISGGDKSNAIPREFRCCIHMEEKDERIFREYLELFIIERFYEFSSVEKDVKWIFSAQKKEKKKEKKMCFSHQFVEKMIQLVMILPSGVVKLSHVSEGLTESSINLSSLKTDEEEGRVVICTKYRSNVPHCIQNLRKQARTIGTLTQASQIEVSGFYPPWIAPMYLKRKDDTKLFEIVKESFFKIRSFYPKTRVSHGGLEPGTLLRRKGQSAVSFGGALHDLHCPSEKVEFESILPCSKVLFEAVKRIGLEKRC